MRHIVICAVYKYTFIHSFIHLSSFFPLSRGVRQGCPLSPLLYVLVAEVLACNIRANPRIIGLSLPGSTSPLPVILQYADDTSLVVASDDSIKATFDTYSLFEKGSGAKLNQSKSKGLWLGSWVVEPILLLLWIGPPLSSRFLGSTLAELIFKLAYPHRCRGERSFVLAAALSFLSGKIASDQCPRFSPNMVCGFFDPHASLGPEGT